MQSDYSELVRELTRHVPMMPDVSWLRSKGMPATAWIVQALPTITTAIITLQAELAEARNQALEDAAKVAIAHSAPEGSDYDMACHDVAHAIRVMKDKP